MAERAAELDSSEFDVVFSAAHMLRLAKLLTHNNNLLQAEFPYLKKHTVQKTEINVYFKKC